MSDVESPPTGGADEHDAARARNAAVYASPSQGHLRALADEASAGVLDGRATVPRVGADYGVAAHEAVEAKTRLEFAEARLVGALATTDGTIRDLATAAGLSIDVVARVLHHGKVTVLSKPGCVQCDATARALTKHGVDFEKVDVVGDVEAFELAKGLGYLAVPVVVTPDGDHWSGFRPDRIAEIPANPEPPTVPALVGPAS